MTSISLVDVYDRLLTHHGPQRWWPADSPFEVMVGAVLVQSTAWTNAEQAIHNLRAANLMSPSAIREVPVPELESMLRPSGFFRSKSRKLKALCRYLGERYADDVGAMSAQPTELLCEELLAVYGIGDETADDILLYALGRPVFVVDAFTRRVFHRLGLCGQGVPYRSLQARFHERLPPDAGLYNEYHALIVRHGNTVCTRRPACSECPLSSRCPRIGVRPEHQNAV